MIDRRTFLTQWVRLILFAIIAVVSGLAFFRGRSEASVDCPAGNQCQGCGKASQCGLPQKQSQ
ncbi:MAG: hypothetical protein R6U86_08535 [Bacteroidales bacterium]